MIAAHQSGFRSLHSTVTVLLDATNNWAYNIDKGNLNAVVFIDLKKAFDMVDHDILLSKLSFYGVQGNSLNWGLSHIWQKFFINGCLSDKLPLSCGVPQGTTLGLLLFLIYINDLPNCLLSSQPRMYADDTHLTFSSNDIIAIDEILNRNLESVNNWLISNKLTLNATKTEFMSIGSRQRLNTLPRPPHLTIGGVPVNQVSTAKSLGVYVDENLSWGSHIEKLIKKVASGVGALKRIRSFVPFETMKLFFNVLVRPHFDYCSVVWGDCNLVVEATKSCCPNFNFFQS